MRPLILSFIVTAIMTGMTAMHLLPAHAAQSPTTQHISKNGAELLVFEAKGCAYCFIFRRDVVPGYRRSPRARNVPMRFIDVHQIDLKQLQLRGPLTMLPTVVFMEHGREVDRITGYMGPEPFFHMVSRLIK